MDFALPLTFIAMVMPSLKKSPAIAAALSAGVVALLANSLPYRLGLIIAALVGIVVGTFLENKTHSEPIPELPIQANLRKSLNDSQITKEQK